MATQRTHPNTRQPGPGHRKHRRLKPLRVILLVLLGLAILLPGSASAYLFSVGQIYDSQTTTIDDAFPAESTRPKARAEAMHPQKTAAPEGALRGTGSVPGAGAAVAETDPGSSATPMNILVMGTDRRGAAGTKVLPSSESNQRADALMLVHIPADRTKIYSISLMRDLWINIPNHGRAKINAALAHGGVPLMVQTVESMFGQRIDHIVMIDFEGLVGLTNALGGVEVNVTQPFVSVHSDRSYAQGPTMLDGKSALDFVRERYAYSDGDYQRVRNQQAFVRALLAKNLSGDTLLNPVRVHNVISAVAPFISVDAGLDAATLAKLALELRNVRAGDMVMFTLPTRGVGTSADGQSIVLPDYGALAGISQALADDSLDTLVASRGLAGGH